MKYSWEFQESFVKKNNCQNVVGNKNMGDNLNLQNIIFIDPNS